MRSRETRKSKRPKVRTVLLAAAAVPLPALAVEKDWKSSISSGNWSTAGNWLQGAIPAAGDDAFIVTSDATNRTVTYDYTGLPITLNSLRLDNTGAGANTLSQGGNTLSTIVQYVGYSGHGAYTQSGGANNVTGSGFDALYVGFNSGASGTYTLSGGSLAVANYELIGWLTNNGTFLQTAGTHTVGAALELGSAAPGVAGAATFTLQGGSLSIGDNEFIGYSSNGSFTQTGGTHSINGTGIAIGFSVGSTGTYTLGSGTLSVPTSSEFIGYNGKGTFIQNGGTNSMGQGLQIGSGANSTVPGGVYTLNNGSLNVVGNTFVGYTGSGGFNQTNGTFATFDLYVGDLAGSSGTFTLSGGILTVADTALIGYLSKGTFKQTGGTNNVTGPGLSIGDSPGSTGSYSLTNGTLAVLNSEFVGYDNIGSFIQSSGTHTVSSTAAGSNGLLIGVSPGSFGTFTLGGGSLMVAGSEFVGYGGKGTFNQTGGAHTVGATLAIGKPGGGAGLYQMTGGTLSAAAVVNSGSFLISGGTATIAGNITGTGSTTVGGGAGAATLSVLGLTQASLTVGANGVVNLSAAANFTGTLSANGGANINFLSTGTSAAGRLTHHANNLVINGTGNVDLANHELLLNNAAPSTIKTYLANAFDAAGNADWSKPGLTSSLARNNPGAYSVAYAYGGDTSAQDAGITTHGGTPLAAGQTLVRAVLTGDANMDGVVNFFDISQLLGYKYNTAQAASYTDGDLNYDGVVDFFDLTDILSANYNSGATFGPAQSGGLSAAEAGPSTPSVPEPAELALIGLAAALLARRRNKT